MSLNFLKNLVKVKAENLEEGMINLATAIDKEGVAEASVKQKMDEHEERIKMLQEASSSYRTEKAEYDRELALYNRYMHEAETIQNILTNLEKAKQDIIVDPSNQAAAAVIAGANEAELTNDLVNLLDAVEKRSAILEKEKREAEEAEQWMNTMKEAVDEISKELLTLRETINAVKRDIAQAEIEKERNKKRAEQAEVVAGLRKSGNKFDTAMNALKNQAIQQQNEAESYKIKADSLKKPVDTTDDIVGKYTTTAAPVSTETLAQRLARLKG